MVIPAKEQVGSPPPMLTILPVVELELASVEIAPPQFGVLLYGYHMNPSICSSDPSLKLNALMRMLQNGKCYTNWRIRICEKQCRTAPVSLALTAQRNGRDDRGLPTYLLLVSYFHHFDSLQHSLFLFLATIDGFMTS